MFPNITPTLDPLACLPKSTAWSSGFVTDVRSGDTLRVGISGYTQTIRYLGINAGRPLPPSDFFGPPAATQNADLTRGQVVWLIPDHPERDQFNTRQRYVVLYDTQIFLNYELVRQGLAQVSPAATPFACQPLLLTAESMARAERLGRWASTPTPARTITPLPTPTANLTISPTATVTGTPPTLTPSATPTGTITPSTFTPTVTGTPPTSTPTASPTATPSPSGDSYPAPTTPAYPT